MKDSLKKQIEGLVVRSISELEHNSSGIKRIVIFSSKKLKEPIEILNYTENRFLNTQFKIDHQNIKVIAIDRYNPERHFQEGDHIIDVGDYLAINFPEFS